MSDSVQLETIASAFGAQNVSVHVLLVNLYSRAILRVPVTLAIENKAERLP